MSRRKEGESGKLLRRTNCNISLCLKDNILDKAGKQIGKAGVATPPNAQYKFSQSKMARYKIFKLARSPLLPLPVTGSKLVGPEKKKYLDIGSNMAARCVSDAPKPNSKFASNILQKSASMPDISTLCRNLPST